MPLRRFSDDSMNSRRVSTKRRLRTALIPRCREVDKRALASRWLSRAKGLADWESWRSAWSVLWNQGSLIWHTCEAHLPEPAEAPSFLPISCLSSLLRRPILMNRSGKALGIEASPRCRARGGAVWTRRHFYRGKMLSRPLLIYFRR